MKKILSILISSMLIIGLISCAKKTQEMPESSISNTIKITYFKVPLNVPLIVAKNMKIYEENFAGAKEPRSVQFLDLSSGQSQTQALSAKLVDFIPVLDAAAAISSAANGFDLRIIGVFSRAPKTFAIETMQKNIKTIADLKGKKIAGPKGSTLHQLLITALKEKNLSMNDIEFIPMAMSEALSAMKEGKTDAALLSDKFMLQGLSQGARILTDAENLLQGIKVIATRKDILDNHPDIVDTYLDAHRRSVKAMVDNWQEAIEMSARELEMTNEEVQHLINLYDFDMAIKPGDKKELEKTQQFLIENRLLDQPVDIEELVVEDWFAPESDPHKGHQH